MAFATSIAKLSPRATLGSELIPLDISRQEPFERLRNIINPQREKSTETKQHSVAQTQERSQETTETYVGKKIQHGTHTHTYLTHINMRKQKRRTKTRRAPKYHVRAYASSWLHWVKMCLFTDLPDTSLWAQCPRESLLY